MIKMLTLILEGKGRLGVKINCTNGSIYPENLYNDGLIKNNNKYVRFETLKIYTLMRRRGVRGQNKIYQWF